MKRAAQIAFVLVAVLILVYVEENLDLGDDTAGSSPTPAGPEAEDLLGALDALEVADELPRDGYERDLFPHWRDLTDSGCDSRQDALISQALGPVQRDPVGCHVVEGDWYSVYDGVDYSGPAAELDIDHVVSLAEAWDSGAARWDTERRERYANDPENLLVVSASSNRSKGDRDVGEWQPEHDAWCLVATMTIGTKTRWELTVDEAERDRLEEMAATCGDPDQQAHP